MGAFVMKKTFIAGCIALAATALPLDASLLRQGDKIIAPYTLQKGLLRAEELFKENNFRDALIFYYEALDMTTSGEVRAKLHFRVGECLEAIKRYEYASYHYKVAMTSGKLPELLQSRAIMKLEHLPDLAQTEEANRLYNRAMALYKRRNIRAAIDDYLESLRLMPTLMEKSDSGLIEDAIKYLTFLSESKDKEPERLLKLASLLELHGEVDKSVETLQQIIIIYADTDQAKQAEEKLERYSSKNTAYLEPKKPVDDLAQVIVEESVFDENFDFTGAGTVSRELPGISFAFKSYNERTEIPPDRFEIFMVSLGTGGERKDFVFISADGIPDRQLRYETTEMLYTLTFTSVEQTVGYIQDLYGDGRVSVNLFSKIVLNLKVEKKAY